jgi:site-specific DNA-methyltransferase (adenine-specific)
MRRNSTKTEEMMLGCPSDLFQTLDSEFHFTIDVAASDLNHLCPRYYTKDTNGLAQNWSNETVWCHPLFDRDIHLWVDKALNSDCLTVLLLPSSTDTRWFARVWDHDSHKPRDRCQIRFLKKRLRFQHTKSNAAFASCVIVIDNRK